MTEQTNISELPLTRIRCLFSVEQYRQFYEDIVGGYIEFLKAEGISWSQFLFAHKIKRIKIGMVQRLRVTKALRPHRDYFRTLDLQSIYESLSHPQFYFLLDTILLHYCQALQQNIDKDIVEAAKYKYRDFMGVVDYEKENDKKRIKDDYEI